MLFEFGFYSSLLLPAVVQGLIYTGLLIFRGSREDRNADYLLGVLVFFYTLRVANWMLGFAGWYDSHDAYSTFMFYFPFSHMFAMGPLVYFYFLSLTNRDFTFRRKHIWHFLPYCLWLLYHLTIFFHDVLIEYYIQGQPFAYHYGTKGNWAEYTDEHLDILNIVLELGVYTSLLYYFVLTFRLYKRYNGYVSRYFSNTAPIRFTWLRNFLIAVIIGQITWLIFRIFLPLLHFPSPQIFMVDWYGYFIWGILIFYISISGYQAHDNLSLALDFDPENKEPTDIPAKTDQKQAQKLQASLEKAMRDKQLYLNPELTLNELAENLNISPSLVSKIINGNLGKNFNEFVNEYRVEAVKNMLQDPSKKHLSVLGIALECGFNSKATFNRAFKKFTQRSPSEFARSQHRDAVSKSEIEP